MNKKIIPILTCPIITAYSVYIYCYPLLTQAEDMMAVLAIALEDSAESDITSEQGTSYISSLEASWQGVCAGLANGQQAQVGYVIYLFNF